MSPRTVKTMSSLGVAAVLLAGCGSGSGGGRPAQAGGTSTSSPATPTVSPTGTSTSSATSTTTTARPTIRTTTRHTSAAPKPAPTRKPPPKPATALPPVPRAGAEPTVRFPQNEPAVGSGANASIGPVPDAAWARMVGYSWTPGCPVSRSQLRYVRVNFWGFDGKRSRGSLVVNASIADEAADAFTRL